MTIAVCKMFWKSSSQNGPFLDPSMHMSSLSANFLGYRPSSNISFALSFLEPTFVMSIISHTSRTAF